MKEKTMLTCLADPTGGHEEARGAGWYDGGSPRSGRPSLEAGCHGQLAWPCPPSRRSTTWPALLAATLFSLLLATPAAAQQGEALLIQDGAAWGYDAWNVELTAAGIPYTQIASADLAAENLGQYDMVVTVSTSGGTYNQRLLDKIVEFESYVQGGGVLIWSGCTQSGETPFPDPPFGGVDVYGTDSDNQIVDAAHPLLDGVIPPVSGNSASHNYFTAIPVGAEIQLSHSANGNPVLYTLHEGNGLLIATGATWEFGWDAGWENGKILLNAIDWGWAFNPCTGDDNDG
ncbi:MAG: hypothetical protein QGH45_06995, partial [Myxococcota bacterium]|nr:hypothetical protein [Myxococcota bacterium]